MIKETKNYFYVGEENDKKAFIQYRIEEDIMILEETLVDESMQGQGIAGKLLDYAVDFARENKYKVKSECSYVTHKFSSSEKYDDVNYKK